MRLFHWHIISVERGKRVTNALCSWTLHPLPVMPEGKRARPQKQRYLGRVFTTELLHHSSPSPSSYVLRSPKTQYVRRDSLYSRLLSLRSACVERMTRLCRTIDVHVRRGVSRGNCWEIISSCWRGCIIGAA